MLQNYQQLNNKLHETSSLTGWDDDGLLSPTQSVLTTIWGNNKRTHPSVFYIHILFSNNLPSPCGWLRGENFSGQFKIYKKYHALDHIFVLQVDFIYQVSTEGTFCDGNSLLFSKFLVSLERFPGYRSNQ